MAEIAHAFVAEPIETLSEQLTGPRHVIISVPSGDATEQMVEQLMGILSPGDVIVDAGNSNFRDSQRRAAKVAERGLEWLDMGVSGGIWGLTVGFCAMVGGKREVFEHFEPAVKALAPAFYAREDTGTPFRYAVAAMAANTALSLAFFPFLGFVGIALATSIASWMNVALLWAKLSASGFFAADARLRRRAPRRVRPRRSASCLRWGSATSSRGRTSMRNTAVMGGGIMGPKPRGEGQFPPGKTPDQTLTSAR